MDKLLKLVDYLFSDSLLPGKRAIFLLLISVSFHATAGEANVVDASYDCNSTCSFSVTVVHADEGWEHFANRWEILTLSGEIIATRVLAHPHAKNKPFTRSLSNIKFPEKTKAVIVRVHDLVHGYGGKEKIIEIK